MSEVTVPVNRAGKHRLVRSKTLEDFAASVETAIQKGRGCDALKNQVCRLIFSDDERISALMLSKWVEWRYGKPNQKLEHSGGKDGSFR